MDCKEEKPINDLQETQQGGQRSELGSFQIDAHHKKGARGQKTDD